MPGAVSDAHFSAGPAHGAAACVQASRTDSTGPGRRCGSARRCCAFALLSGAASAHTAFTRRLAFPNAATCGGGPWGTAAGWIAVLTGWQPRRLAFQHAAAGRSACRLSLLSGWQPCGISLQHATVWLCSGPCHGSTCWVSVFDGRQPGRISLQHASAASGGTECRSGFRLPVLARGKPGGLAL